MGLGVSLDLCNAHSVLRDGARLLLSQMIFNLREHEVHDLDTLMTGKIMAPCQLCSSRQAHILHAGLVAEQLRMFDKSDFGCIEVALADFFVNAAMIIPDALQIIVIGVQI